MSMIELNRRLLLGGLAAAALARAALAQPGPIKLGTLTPLTGAGGPYGPTMVKAAQAVVAEINAAGGMMGRMIELVSEDDQTNPEAAVRAARKLIDVDHVIAIMGTWASAVTTAVAPLCWESQVMLFTVSGGDNITKLPHQGYIIRTQPNTVLQGQKFGAFINSLGAKRVFIMAPQTPFTQSQFETVSAAVKPAGGSAELLIYDDKKPSYRSEVDQVLRSKPDLILMGGYTPDTTVLLKDLFRANFSGVKMAFGYSVNAKLIEGLPADVAEGVYTLSPSPAAGSPAYQHLVDLIHVDAPDTYTCQIADHVSLIALAIAQAKLASGVAIKDAVRAVSQGSGTVVHTAVEGLKAIASGQAVNYDGASGPCDFTPEGDILDCQFRYEQVKAGKLVLLKIA